jgi:hypothetical protein
MKNLHDDGVLDLFVFRSFVFGGGHILSQEGRRLPIRRQGRYNVIIERAVLLGRRGSFDSGLCPRHTCVTWERRACLDPSAVHYCIYYIIRRNQPVHYIIPTLPHI